MRPAPRNHPDLKSVGPSGLPVPDICSSTPAGARVFRWTSWILGPRGLPRPHWVAFVWMVRPCGLFFGHRGLPGPRLAFVWIAGPCGLHPALNHRGYERGHTCGTGLLVPLEPRMPDSALEFHAHSKIAFTFECILARALTLRSAHTVRYGALGCGRALIVSQRAHFRWEARGLRCSNSLAGCRDSQTMPSTPYHATLYHIYIHVTSYHIYVWYIIPLYHHVNGNVSLIHSLTGSC